MNTQHTHGPWVAFGGLVRSNEDSGPVADALIRGRNEETVQANARLIAAAPDMLEALEYCVHWLKALSAQNVPVDNDLKRCLDAISKATGKATP